VNPPALPLSFGPDAVTLRTSDNLYSLTWKSLARLASGGKKITACTVHVMMNGTFTVMVDSEKGPTDHMYGPRLFAELFAEHGKVIRKEGAH